MLLTDSLGTFYLAASTNQSNPHVTSSLRFVLENAPPYARIIFPNTSEVDDAVPLNFTSEIDDVDHDNLTIRWKSDKDGILGRQGNLTGVKASYGSHNISLEVSDGSHLTIDWIIITYVDVTTVNDTLGQVFSWIGLGGFITVGSGLIKWLYKRIRDRRKRIAKWKNDDFKKDKSEIYEKIRAGMDIKFEEVQQKLLLTTGFFNKTLNRLKKRKIVSGTMDKTNEKFNITGGAEKFIDELEKRFPVGAQRERKTTSNPT
jgi:hypothetical protein